MVRFVVGPLMLVICVILFSDGFVLNTAASGSKMVPVSLSGIQSSHDDMDHNNNENTGSSDYYKPNSLESIRSTLIRQEETIIFALIERAQFRQNKGIYQVDHATAVEGKGEDSEAISLFDYMLMETERLHAKVRRYTSPEEHPFFPNFLPAPILPALEFPKLQVSSDKAISDKDSKGLVDVNSDIRRWHVEKILKRLCKEGDDEQYGSSALNDIRAMQALSRRIHYGKFVAESKFLSDPQTYTDMVMRGDTDGIIDLLTNKEVERKVLRRSYAKASTYGQDITGQTDGYRVAPELIAEIYRDMIIPLTKDVEVRYLYNRVGRLPPPAETYLERCRAPLDAFDDPEKLNEFKT